MNKIKPAIACALFALLSACAPKPPLVIPVSAPATTAIVQTVTPVTPMLESTAFKNQQVMTPNESIEKNKLLVSYSMKVIPDVKGHLVQISMIFRNMKDQNTNIKPKIALLDANGNPIKAYSKKGFLKLTAQMTASSGTQNNVNLGSAEERIKWAHSYWLKDHFTLPPRGMEIGELIYHCERLNYPMKLTVNSAGQAYIFTIKNTTATEQSKPAN
jgi:hypothetical protein